jgi:hypothetical protein
MLIDQQITEYINDNNKNYKFPKTFCVMSNDDVYMACVSPYTSVDNCTIQKFNLNSPGVGTFCTTSPVYIHSIINIHNKYLLVGYRSACYFSLFEVSSKKFKHYHVSDGFTMINRVELCCDDKYILYSQKGVIFGCISVFDIILAFKYNTRTSILLNGIGSSLNYVCNFENIYVIGAFIRDKHNLTIYYYSSNGVDTMIKALSKDLITGEISHKKIVRLPLNCKGVRAYKNDDKMTRLFFSELMMPHYIYIIDKNNVVSMIHYEYEIRDIWVISEYPNLLIILYSDKGEYMMSLIDIKTLNIKTGLYSYDVKETIKLEKQPLQGYQISISYSPFYRDRRIPLFLEFNNMMTKITINKRFEISNPKHIFVELPGYVQQEILTLAVCAKQLGIPRDIVLRISEYL